MALDDLNKLGIAFKRLQGKAHTQETFASSEEPITSNVSISYSTVFGENITPNPISDSGLTNLYNTDGIVEKIRFEIEKIPDTLIGINQSQGYRLKLPSDYTANGALKAIFSSGDLLYEALGKLQIVPSLYGELKGDGSTEYDPKLYETDGTTEIPKFDSINWTLDFYNGVLFVQNPISGLDILPERPGYLEAYLFVGKYLDDIIFSGGTIPTGDTGNYVDYDVFTGYTGTTNEAITGNTSDISDLDINKQDVLTADKGIDVTALSNDKIKLDLSNYTPDNNININLTGSSITAKIIDGRTTQYGLEYDDNYSSSYSTLSLVHKGYVDSMAAGLRPKENVLVGTTSDIDIGGGTFGGIVDGVTLQDGDRVLVKSQTVLSENGIYIYVDASDTFTRSLDMDGSPSGETKQGDFLTIVSGDTLSLTQWVLISDNPITIGSSDLIFNLLSKQSIYTAGNGIGISGNTIYFRGDEVDGNLLEWSGNTLNVQSDPSKLDVTSFNSYSGNTYNTITGITETVSGLTTSVSTIESNYISGATNLGSGTIIATGVTNNKIDLRTISGGTNVNITTSDGVIVINSTASGSTVNEIGPDESGNAGTGSYDEGLYTDFSGSTEIGTPIDRFNKILKQLVPPAAPSLSKINSSSTFASGKLSFGTTKNDISYTNVDNSAGNGVVDFNGLYSVSGTRLGIIRLVVNGTLNDQVSGDPSGIPYEDNAINNAHLGTLTLELNGSVEDTINLSSTTNAITTTNLSVSAVKYVKFSNGAEFDGSSYRTGTYLIPTGNMDDGFNYIKITHNDGSTTVTTNYLEWVYDSNTDTISGTGESMGTPSLSGSKYISGVEYNTSGSIVYGVTMNNVYRNVYSSSNTAISYISKNNLGNLTNMNITGAGIINRTTSTLTTLPNLDNSVSNPENKFIVLATTFPISSNIVLGNVGTLGNLSAGVSVIHPIGSKSYIGSVATETGFLFYNITQSSNMENEDFTGEINRLKNQDYSSLSYSSINGTTHDWDSTEDLISGDVNHNNGLLVFNSELIYPNSSYLTSQYGITSGHFAGVDNSPSGNANYSAATGERVYNRRFKSNNTSSLSTLSFSIENTGSDTNFLTDGGTSGTPSGDNIKFEFIIKRVGGATHGWANPFASTGNPEGIANLTTTHSGGITSVLCTLSTTPRVGNGDIVIVRIKTSNAWSNRISNLSITNI